MSLWKQVSKIKGSGVVERSVLSVKRTAIEAVFLKACALDPSHLFLNVFMMC